MKIYEKGIK